MRQLPIDHNADAWAAEYVKLLQSTGLRKKALKSINDLILKFNPGDKVYFYKHRSNTRLWWIKGQTVIDYLTLVRKRYDSARVLHPCKFEHFVKRFEELIPRTFINCKISVNSGDKKESLSASIVTALHYKEIRAVVYPIIAQKMGVKACVYCNANYTINDDNNKGYYDLDHWKPKALYPYLSTSFFNLQPSCAYCNRNKSDDDGAYFRLWGVRGQKRLQVLGVTISDNSIARYLINHDSSQLMPIFFAHKYGAVAIRDNTDLKLHITDIYNEHKDVAEEVLWKYIAYKSSYVKGWKNAIKNAVPSIAEVNRFIIGAYDDPKDVHKRPLTDMVQNVARSLGLIK